MRANAQIEAEVLGTLDRFNEAIIARDVEAIVRLFAQDEDVLLIGSEAFEVGRGPDEIEKLLRQVLDRPQSYRWRWQWRTVSTASTARSVAWVAADAVVE